MLSFLLYNTQMLHLSANEDSIVSNSFLVSGDFCHLLITFAPRSRPTDCQSSSLHSDSVPEIIFRKN